MNRWIGKVAVVTGSSGGIGLAISTALVNNGVKVVGLARRIDLLNEASEKLGKNEFFPFKCDVTVESEILAAFKWIEERFGGFDILVNNAGILDLTHILDSTIEKDRKVIDTNLIAPAIFAREAIRSMKARNVMGHIINICCIAGLYLEAINLPLGMYGPTKYGLRALGIELRHEITMARLSIKITNISPGFVQTGIVEQMSDLMNIPTDLILKGSDIADAVIYALGTPDLVEIPEITLLPHGMGSQGIEYVYRRSRARSSED